MNFAIINGILAALKNLQASWVTSGRFGKNRFEWTLNKLLLGAGAGADPTEIDAPGGATKEFFFPCTTVSTEPVTTFGNYPVGRLDAINESAYIVFKVPHDFVSIVNAEIIIIPNVTQGAADLDIYSSYGAIGESCTTHTENDIATTYNIVQYIDFAVDIAGILSAIAADDYVGIRIKEATAGHDVYVLGVRFKYS